MTADPVDPTQNLIKEIQVIHAFAWATAAPPTSKAATDERVMLEAMRKLSLELLQQGVTTAVMEGAYLMWWLRLACLNHGFAKGGFERSLARVGPLVGPVSEIIMRLGNAIKDDGPSPEMQHLGDKIEQLRALHGGAVMTSPVSREEEDAQTAIAHALIRQTVLVATDMGIPAVAFERMLLYFWFRCVANRCGLKEVFFQKVERHWNLVMQHVNQYMDEQAAADRQAAGTP